MSSIVRLLFVSVLFFAFAPALFAVDLPAALKQAKPGRYELVSSQHADLLNARVRGLVVVPPGIKRGKVELILFYHGATGNKNYYSTHPTLDRWAARDGFVLLSMQNPYGFARNASMETGIAIGDAIFAGAELAEALADAGVVDEDKIFTTGFSAGGQPALWALFKKPEVFAGFASFHGNYYYPGIFFGDSEMARKMAETNAIYFDGDYESGMKRLKKQLRRKKAFLSVGGRDVPRVMQQVPEAKEFLESQFPMVDLKYRQYPAEGHQLTEANWRDFLSFIR